MTSATPAGSEAAVGASERGLVAAMCACVVAVQSIVAAVNLCVPALAAGAMRPTPMQVTLVVDVYIVVFACLLLPAGVAAGRLGHQNVLMAGLFVYAFGCLGCACAPDVVTLIAARAVTGAGAALVLPISLSTLTRALPPRRRPAAVAAWTGATFLGGALGNVIGGIVVQYGSWRLLFVAQAAFAVLLVAAVLHAVPSDPPRVQRQAAAKRFDVAGTVLFTVAVVAAMTAVIGGPELGWDSREVIGGAATCLVCLAVFVPWERRSSHPMLDLGLLAAARMRAGGLGTALLFVGMAALFYGNAQYLQYAKGFTPAETGFACLPLALGLFIASRISVPAASILGSRGTLAVGLALFAIGFYTLSRVRVDTSYALYAVTLLETALAAGLVAPVLSTGIMAAAGDADAGAAAGLNSLAREVGSAVGVALFGTVAFSRFADRVPAELSGDGSPHALSARLAAATPGDAVTQAFTKAAAAAYVIPAVLAVTAGLYIVHCWRPPKAAGKWKVPVGTGRVSFKDSVIMASSGTSKGARMPKRDAGVKPNLG